MFYFSLKMFVIIDYHGNDVLDPHIAISFNQSVNEWSTARFPIDLKFDLGLFFCVQNYRGRHRIKLVRNPSSESSGNKFVGLSYWRGPNQTLANQLQLIVVCCKNWYSARIGAARMSDFRNVTAELKKDHMKTSDWERSRWWKRSAELTLWLKLIAVRV